MDQQPNYRRRRVAMAAAGLLLLGIADRDAPTLGTLSIAFDGDRPHRIDATLAPPWDAVAMAMALAAERLAR